MPKITYQKQKELNLSEYHSNRKRILIKRNAGGLGDIFMHRLIFEDFKKAMPDSHLVFACPLQYFQAVSDHPYIDEIIDHKEIQGDFGVRYDTSLACNEYEMKHAPFCDKHRSDIWAEHCGLKLTNHNMNFIIADDEKSWAKAFIDKLNVGQKKTVAVIPVSAMSNKNMLPEQIQPVIDVLSKDYFVFTLNSLPLPQYNTPCIHGTSIRQFVSILNHVDYVISVDTSAFHCAGGLGKPVVAIFGWADGTVYGKYYPKMVLVQKHRNYMPDWTCGPCYNFPKCCKVDSKTPRKPCITEITPDMILSGFDEMVSIYG